MNKQALGRGLESLIPKTEKKPENFLEIRTDSISSNPFQPRKKFDERKLEELADSFRHNGIIQPVIVRETEKGYQLVAGERRLQAARLAGFESIPALIRKFDDLQMLQMSIIENIQREDLNALEEAQSFNRLTKDFGLTHEKVAEAIGKSRTAVANTLRLLKLPEEVREEISEGRLSRGHAIALLGLQSPSEQTALCKNIVSEGLSVRETEKLVKRRLQSETPPRQKPAKPAELTSLEEKLQIALGTKVNINKFKKGGRVEIEFYSDEDLTRLLELFQINMG